MRRFCWRLTVCCWIVCAIPPVAAAGKADGPQVTELLLTPRAVEEPLMKYRLMPAEYELRSGNAAPILLRLPWQQNLYFTNVVPTFEQHLEMRLDDPKLIEAGGVLDSRFYHELRRAAYRRTAEWEYPIGEEPAAGIILPDIQGAREIVGRGLSVWIRYHLARGELDKAREGILVGLAVSRHYSRTPFTVTQLVCVAIDSMLLRRLEEMLGARDCPNLYWALTALPRPFVDIRPAFELEQRFLELTVDGLDDLEALRTEEQWEERARAVVRLYLDTGGPKQPTEAEAKQIRERILQRARAELPAGIEGGADRVTRMSDAEAGLRWFLQRHREQSQQIAALMSLEPPAAVPVLSALQDRLASFRADLGVSTLFIFENPLNVYVAAYGVQRRIDALRTVEAIRNYAATHDGNLPESLTMVRDTPVPMDLLTGLPFHYAVSDGSATLTANGIQVQGKEIGAMRYRISWRKK